VSGDPSQTENRRSFRCNVPESQREAVLRVGRRRLAVRLYNESAGGFAVWCERDPALAPDDRARLFTVFGTFEVRVAHVGELESDPPAEEPDGESPPSTPPSRFRIGLEVLGELDKDFRAPRTGTRRLSEWSTASSPFALGVLVTVLAASVVVGAVTAARWLISPAAAHIVPFLSSAEPEVSTGQLRPRAVARTLRLNDVQRDRLVTIAETAAGALRQLDELWRYDPPAERTRKQRLLLEATRREIMSMLTREQQRRWEALFEGWPDAVERTSSRGRVVGS